MPFETVSENIVFFIIIGAMVALVIVTVKSFTDTRKSNKQLYEELDKPYEPTITEYDVRVLRKYCYVETYGTKSPQSVGEYYIEFLTFDGKELKFKVLAEDYHAITENSVGTLAVINDNFYGFDCRY